MKLSELHEESIGDAINRWTPKRMSDDEIIDWCKKNASSFLKQKNPIYRGTAEGLTGLLNTANLNRTSANTYDTYNLWIDNHQSWKGFPKRSQSLISSTGADNAELFGDLYLVIPKDTDKIGICPEYDMWGSFDDVENIMGKGSDASDFLTLLNRAEIHSSNWEELKRISKEITPESIRQRVQNPDSGPVKGRKHRLGFSDSDYDNLDNKGLLNLADWMEKHEYATIYSALADIFDPEINGFELQDASSFNNQRGSEVWTGGGDVMQVEINGMSDKLRKFFSEYFDI